MTFCNLPRRAKKFLISLDLTMTEFFLGTLAGLKAGPPSVVSNPGTRSLLGIHSSALLFIIWSRLSFFLRNVLPIISLQLLLPCENTTSFDVDAASSSVLICSGLPIKMMRLRPANTTVSQSKYKNKSKSKLAKPGAESPRLFNIREIIQSWDEFSHSW